MSIKIYENGWRDINSIKRYENGWKSCSFAKKYENGQWVDAWINDKGTWGPITSDLPFDMKEWTAIVHNNTIHLLGSEGSANQAAHYYWNGSSWVSRRPADKIASGRYSAVVYNNLLYQFCYNSAVYSLGGNDSTWNFEYIYLPFTFSNTMTVVYNNELHMFGSWSTQYETCHYAWNGSSLREVSTLPCRLFAPVVYNNKIYAIDQGNNKLYAFNGSSWIEVNTIPIDVINPATCVWKGKIHLMYQYDHYTFDENTWEYVGVTPFKVYQTSCLVWNDSIVLLGGYSNKRDRSSFSVV